LILCYLFSFTCNRKYSTLYFPHCLKVKRNRLSQKVDTLINVKSQKWQIKLQFGRCGFSKPQCSEHFCIFTCILHFNSPCLPFTHISPSFWGVWQWGFTPHLAHMACHLFYAKHHTRVVQIPASYHAA